MTYNHKGFDLAGIFMTYVMSIIYILATIGLWLGLDTEYRYSGYEYHGEGIIFILSVITLVLTILYDTNKITNYIFIGGLGIISSIAGGIFLYLEEFLIVGIIGIPTSIIGGIFILIGQPKTGNNTKLAEDKNLFRLEQKLKQLDTLLTKGVLTKEEYDSKRKSIIEKH